MIFLVEGDGDKRSLPVLLKRELQISTIRCVDMRGKSNIIRKPRGFEDTIRRQYELGACSFTILMDFDVTFAPYESLDEEKRDMCLRAEALERELQVPVRVYWAVVAMESWLIGGIGRNAEYCGLKGSGRISNNTETSPTKPEQWLKNHLKRGDYGPAVQECLARYINMPQAKACNRSLRAFLGNLAKESQHLADSS